MNLNPCAKYPVFLHDFLLNPDAYKIQFQKTNHNFLSWFYFFTTWLLIQYLFYFHKHAVHFVDIILDILPPLKERDSGVTGSSLRCRSYAPSPQSRYPDS